MSTAISFENVSKMYQLGVVGTGTLSNDIKRWWYTSILNREDPFLKVGQVNNRASKAKGDFVYALKDITFDVEQGDIVGIIGKNGAGKSTLLKLLSRITAPTAGVIRARGRIASLLEVGTGFVGELTGRENIYMNGSIMGMTKHEIDRKLDEIIDFSGCEMYIDTPVKRYSSGMTVRLGFAVAAFLEPEILVVDEVLAVGDSEFQKKAIGKMQDVSRGEGRTVLFVSHNMAAVRSLCKNGVLLENGMVDFVGTASECVDRYMMNQVEYSKIDISKIEKRAGSGILRFTDVKFVNSRGEETDTFEVGESMYIEVFFDCDEALNNCRTSRIDVGINNMFDVRVTWLSTNIYMDKIPTNQNKVRFTIKQLCLNEGVYNLNLFCNTNLGVADWVQNVSRISVVLGDFYHTGRRVPNEQGMMITNFVIE